MWKNGIPTFEVALRPHEKEKRLMYVTLKAGSTVVSAICDAKKDTQDDWASRYTRWELWDEATRRGEGFRGGYRKAIGILAWWAFRPWCEERGKRMRSDPPWCWFLDEKGEEFNPEDEGNRLNEFMYALLCSWGDAARAEMERYRAAVGVVSPAANGSLSAAFSQELEEFRKWKEEQARYQREREQKAQRIRDHGTVYLMANGEHIKIGATFQLANRHRSLQKERGTPLDILYVIRGVYFRKERAVHAACSAYRLEGEKEWYTRCDEVIDLFCSLGGQLYVPEPSLDEGA